MRTDASSGEKMSQRTSRSIRFGILVMLVVAAVAAAPLPSSAITFTVDLAGVVIPQIVVDIPFLTAGTPADLAFDLVGGDLGIGNNTATVSLFTGAALDPLDATVFGDVSPIPPDISASATLRDTDFFNEVLQPVILGSAIGFDLAVTTNVQFDADPATADIPDAFAFFILDSLGSSKVLTNLPGNALFEVDASGDVVVASVIENPNATVPQPGTIVLVAATLALALLRGTRRA
jgi:hypothetical protein